MGRLPLGSWFGSQLFSVVCQTPARPAMGALANKSLRAWD